MGRLGRTRRLLTRAPMPAIAATVRFPPPVTALLDPTPFAAAIIRVAGSQTAKVGPASAIHRDRGKHKRVRRPVIRNALTDDHARIVERLRHGQKAKIAPVEIGERVQIGHLAVRKKKGMHGSIFYRGKSDDESRSVDRESATLITAERAEIGGIFVSALESVIRRGLSNIGSAHEIRRIICVRCAPRAAEGAEILHFPILIEKGVDRSVRDQGGTHDVSGGVDPISCAGRAPKRAEIGNVEGDASGLQIKRARKTTLRTILFAYVFIRVVGLVDELGALSYPGTTPVLRNGPVDGNHEIAARAEIKFGARASA